jgi:HD domain
MRRVAHQVARFWRTARWLGSGGMDSMAARRVAGAELAALTGRLRHVTAVAELAASVPVELSTEERDVLVSAAWLHDVGYSPRLVATGFHPLDGARWLAAQGEQRLAQLVAYHSGATYEARYRGLVDELAEFQPEASLVADVLTWCDLRTGPTGERVEPRNRLAEIVHRYGPEHVVSRSIRAAEPELLATCERAAEALTR